MSARVTAAIEPAPGCASAVAKRRQPRAPRPRMTQTQPSTAVARRRTGRLRDVGLSKEDFDAIPQDTREAIVASIDKVRKLDDGFRELELSWQSAQTHEQGHPEIPEDLFDIFKGSRDTGYYGRVRRGREAGACLGDVFASLPKRSSARSASIRSPYSKVTEGMPKL